MKSIPNYVNKLIMQDKYDEAIALAKKELRRLPCTAERTNDDYGLEHWYLMHISSAYYEKRNYRRALLYAEKALELYPNCPLALWHYCGPLCMLDRYDEAIGIYKSLTRGDFDSFLCAKPDAGLKTDCRFHISKAYEQLGDIKNALKWAKLTKRYYSPEGLLKKKELDRWLNKLCNLVNG